MDGRRGRFFAPTAVLYEPNTLQLMKRIIRIIVLVILVVAAILVGGSLYLLRYSLRPDATMEAKNATSYEYMYREYPFLESWVDSLRQRDALRDTTMTGRDGERLHALYAWLTICAASPRALNDAISSVLSASIWSCEKRTSRNGTSSTAKKRGRTSSAPLSHDDGMFATYRVCWEEPENEVL